MSERPLSACPTSEHDWCWDCEVCGVHAEITTCRGISPTRCAKCYGRFLTFRDLPGQHRRPAPEPVLSVAPPPVTRTTSTGTLLTLVQRA